ncbi:MAG: tRNA 2-thiouridine(34) synthase MnmA [Treponematales bacterium]
MNGKAAVAMSGGVDSSVAAALAREEGWDCVGLTLKLFDGGSRCCSLTDVNDARDAARRLGIPHYVLNFTGDFRDEVIRRFVETYESGGTPNPCIDCNRYIKFEKLLHRARQLDYGHLVTGHYARIEKSGGRWLLKKARDEKKDQSYVLYCLTQAHLARTLFPLGGKTKEETRRIAAERGLLNAAKRDSQDICFVSGRDYGAFIEAWTGKRCPEGDILDLDGKTIGRHRGIVRYTLGQRRGVGVARNEPVYVAAKSAARNTVTLGPESSLYSKALIARDINLIALPALERPLRVKVKTRYLQREQCAVAEQTGADELRIEFDEPQRAITPGQSAVMYDGDTVIGGGVIAG